MLRLTVTTQHQQRGSHPMSLAQERLSTPGLNTELYHRKVKICDSYHRSGELILGPWGCFSCWLQSRKAILSLMRNGAKMILKAPQS